jgi:hypothetical protein
MLGLSSGRKADSGASIAIWNYNKVVLSLGSSVWGINVAFLVQGKSLPASLTADGPGISYTCDLSSGTVRVNNKILTT